MAPKAPGRQRRAPRLLEKQSETPEVAAWAQTQVKAAEETPGSLEEVTGTPARLGWPAAGQEHVTVWVPARSQQATVYLQEEKALARCRH